jgi:hypothetical protein
MDPDPNLFFPDICYYFKNYYMNTQRECIRLESISNSPIVSGFSYTMNGLPTLRATISNNFLHRQSDLVTVNKSNRTAKRQ